MTNYRYIIFSLLLVCFSTDTKAQIYPDYSSTFVNDFADIIDAETEERIIQLLKNASKSRGVEMTVVTIHSREQYGFNSTIESFATGLFNFWGVGNADRNDGIMILVAISNRDMRIELGKGYPDFFDGWSQLIIDNHFLPYFKKGQYAKGIEIGVQETIKQIDLNKINEDSSIASTLNLLIHKSVYAVKSGGIISWISGGCAFLFSLFGLKKYRRSRPRKCTHCNNKMQLLSEIEDNAYLNLGQVTEESVKSKDYDVWHCRFDDNIIIETYNKWFSRHSACKKCKYHTLHSNRTVISHATTSRTGSARINYNCKHCSAAWSETVTIPMETESSSSSSGSSFSGGSSSGGGASGSW